MAWLAQFKLGRPGAEASFEINPAGYDNNDLRIADHSRAVDGSFISIEASHNRPTLRLSGNYITADFWNALRGLLIIGDTFLIFEPHDLTGTQWYGSRQDRVVPTLTTSVTLPSDSYTRGAQLRAAAVAAPTLFVQGVWRTYQPGESGAGTNYFLGTYTYSQNFNALLDADLNAQDGYVGLVYVGGSQDIRVVTDATIEGTKCLQVRAGGAAGANYCIYCRQTTTLYDAYTVSWRGRIVPTGFSSITNVSANSAIGTSMTGIPAITAGAPWTVEQLEVGNTEYAQLFLGATLVLTYQMNPVSTFTNHLYEIIVSGTTITFRIDSVVRYAGTLARTYCDKIKLAGFSTYASSLLISKQDTITVTNDRGSYDPATRILTLGTPLPDLSPVFLTFRSTALAVHMHQVPAKTQGGWINLWKYDLELEGA